MGPPTFPLATKRFGGLMTIALAGGGARTGLPFGKGGSGLSLLSVPPRVSSESMFMSTGLITDTGTGIGCSFSLCRPKCSMLPFAFLGLAFTGERLGELFMGPELLAGLPSGEIAVDRLETGLGVGLLARLP